MIPHFLTFLTWQTRLFSEWADPPARLCLNISDCSKKLCGRHWECEEATRPRRIVRTSYVNLSLLNTSDLLQRTLAQENTTPIVRCTRAPLPVLRQTFLWECRRKHSSLETLPLRTMYRFRLCPTKDHGGICRAQLSEFCLQIESSTLGASNSFVVNRDANEKFDLPYQCISLHKDLKIMGPLIWRLDDETVPGDGLLFQPLQPFSGFCDRKPWAMILYWSQIRLVLLFPLSL